MRLFVLVFLLLLSANPLFAQGNEGVDLTFNPIASKQFTYDGFGGVRAVQQDGKIIISGSFRVVNGVYRNGIARLNPDGSTDTSFNCEQACNFNVYSVVIQPDGKILIAGATSIETTNVSSARVARLNSDGSLDSSFISAINQDGSLAVTWNASLWAVQPDGKIYASRSAASTHANITTLYRLNPNGSIDSSFSSMTFDTWGFRHFLSKLVVLPDGKLLVSGSHYFGFIFRVNPDGTKDNTFESPALSNNFQGNALGVNSFGFQPDGKLVFIGSFDFVNGILRNGFARLNANGSVDMGFEIPIFTRNKMEVLSNGKILVSSLNTILRFNADGTQDDTFVLPGGIRYYHSWRLDNSERILALVELTESGAAKFVRLNSDGSLDSTFNANVGTVGSVSAIGAQSDGKIIFGGDFDYVNDGERNNITRVNADGSLDETFNVGSGFDGQVYVILPQTDGKVLIGGLYNTYNGFGQKNLIRLNPDGTVDTSFLPVVDNEVRTIVRQSDGKVLFGGAFTNVNGVNRNAVVRLNSDGSLDSAFNPILNNASIGAIVIQSDGKILIGGVFVGVNGFSRSNLARLNSDGTTDLAFNASIGFVNRISVQPDGKILVNTGSSIRRVNNNGSADNTFQSQTLMGLINTMLLQSDGTVLIGGTFTSINALPRNRFARLSANGGLDTTFVPSGANNEVSAIATQPDGKILAGGLFSSIGGVTRPGIARLSASTFRRVTNFDFDGDGLSDVSVFRPSTNTWYIIQSSNFQVSQQSFGASGDIATPADFDGDGKTDLAIFRPSTGTWWYKSSIDSIFRATQWGAGGDIPLPSDFDGDGRADFIVYRPSQNRWYRLGNGTNAQSNVFFGASGDLPLTGDFDGDGKSDPAIFRPSTGDWWYQSSVDNSQRAAHWGVSTDKVAPGDYDGDGRTDLAVYRPSTGVWYIFNSSNSTATILQFGLTEDRPVAADYDGDGRADIAVFRPSTGVWYVQRTTSGFWGVNWGVSTDVAIPNAFIP